MPTIKNGGGLLGSMMSINSKN